MQPAHKPARFSADPSTPRKSQMNETQALHAGLDKLLNEAADQALVIARAAAPDAPEDDLRAMCTRIAATRMLEDLEAVRPDVKVPA